MSNRRVTKVRLERLKNCLADAEGIIAQCDELIELYPFVEKYQAKKLHWQNLRVDIIAEIQRCESIELPCY